MGVEIGHLRRWVALWPVGLAEQEIERSFEDSWAFVPEMTLFYLQTILPLPEEESIGGSSSRVETDFNLVLSLMSFVTPDKSLNSQTGSPHMVPIFGYCEDQMVRECTWLFHGAE